MRRMKTTEWFWRWLRRHRALLPHQGWATYTGDDIHPPLDKEAKGELMLERFEGWMRAFEANGVTERIAIKASRKLQAEHPGWPEHHLGAIVRVAVKLIDEERQRDEQERKARERAEAEATIARREKLRAAWGLLSDGDQARIRSWVEAEFPHLQRWPGFVAVLCLERLGAELDRGSTLTTPPRRRRPAIGVAS